MTAPVMTDIEKEIAAKGGNVMAPCDCGWHLPCAVAVVPNSALNDGLKTSQVPEARVYGFTVLIRCPHCGFPYALMEMS